MSLLRDIPLNGSWSGLSTSGAVLQTDPGLFNILDNPGSVPGYMDFVPDPLGQRGTVMKSSVDSFAYPTPGNPDGTTGNRSEFYCPSEPVSAGVTCERWYKFGLLFTSEWGGADNRLFSVMQMHDKPDAGDNPRWPNLMLLADGDDLQPAVPKTDPPAEDVSRRYIGSAPLVKNKWIDVVLHVRWSQEAATGLFEMFVSGVPIFREIRRANAFVDAYGPQFKLGVYNTYKHTGSGKICACYYSAVKHYDGIESYSDMVGAISALTVTSQI